MKVQIKLKNLKFLFLSQVWTLQNEGEWNHCRNGYKVHRHYKFLSRPQKEDTQVEKVRKILRSLTSDWEKKTTVIEEANDLSTMSLENLIGNLMAYEV